MTLRPPVPVAITWWDTKHTSPIAASQTVHTLRQIQHESIKCIHLYSWDNDDNNDEAHDYDDNDNNVKCLGSLAFAAHTLFRTETDQQGTDSDLLAALTSV